MKPTYISKETSLSLKGMALIRLCDVVLDKRLGV